MGILSKFIASDTDPVPSEGLTKLDKDWLNSSYLLDVKQLSSEDEPNAYWNNAYLKYTDTSLGGNYGINTKYGFTPSADVPIAGRLSGREEYDSMSQTMDFGMGSKYSEMFDDTEQILFLELGDAKFNSLLSTAINAMDYGTSVVANSGRSLSAYYAGKAIGTGVGVVALFMAFPFWGAALFLGGVATAKLLSAGSDFYYYKMDPSMYKYWRAVNNCTSQLFSEMGFTVPELMDSKPEGNLGLPVKVTSEFREEIEAIIPGLLTDENDVDVFAIANKIQILTNLQVTAERKHYNSGGKAYTYADKVSREKAGRLSSWLDELFKIYNASGKIGEQEEDIILNNNGNIDKVEGGNKEPSVSTPKSPIKADSSVVLSESEIEERGDWLDEVKKYVDSAARFGAGAATFRVEYTGAVTETFSNTVKDIPIKDTLNNVSRKTKDIRFSVAGGNLISDNLDKAVKYAGDFAMGALDGASFGLSNMFTALMGGGFFDIPKMWDDSSFEYQKHTFKARLGGPYGHPLAQAQDMYIPLFMLICAVASQSVGKAGYTSPMLCRPFIKGIMAPSMAIMDSLVIERGVGNIGFDSRGRPLAIDVTFSFIDLSSFISMPVEAGVFGPINSAMDDSSPMARYIQLLAGRDYYTTKYAAPKIALKYDKLRKGFGRMSSPAAMGTAIGNSIGGSVVGALLNGFSLPATQSN